MKNIKLYENFINEKISSEAAYIHNITGAGQKSVQNFIDANNIDANKLAEYVKLNKDHKEKYDVRDMISGTGLGSDKNRRENFIKKFKRSKK